MGRGRGRLAVGGGRGAAGSRPAPPPMPRGEPGGAGPGPGEPGVRGHAGAVALPRVRSPLPPRISFSGGEGNPPGVAGSHRGFEVPAAAARAPRGGGAWPAARMLHVYPARSAGRCARGAWWGPRGCERACSSEAFPPPPPPARGSPPPTRDPPQSGAGLCLPRVATAWGRWGLSRRRLWSPHHLT